MLYSTVRNNELRLTVKASHLLSRSAQLSGKVSLVRLTKADSERRLGAAEARLAKKGRRARAAAIGECLKLGREENILREWDGEPLVILACSYRQPGSIRAEQMNCHYAKAFALDIDCHWAPHGEYLHWW